MEFGMLPLRRLALTICATVMLLLASCGGTEPEGTSSAGDDAAAQSETGSLDDNGGVVTDDDTGGTDPGETTDQADVEGDASGTDDAGTDDAGTDEETDGSDTQGSCTGAPGCACASNLDCDNSVCLDTPEGKRCAFTCIDTCTKGYTCEKLGTSDVVFVCMPNFLTLCSPCKTTKDCSPEGTDSLCLDYGDAGSFCGGPCKVDADCPDGGYTCDEVLNPETKTLTKQCKLAKVEGKQPVCGCSVWAQAASMKTGCKITNGFGTCAGERQCEAGAMGACKAATPAEESCNGLDDDCNGVTDILPATKVCSKSAWLPVGSQKACVANAYCTQQGESCNPGKGLCQTLIGTCTGVASCSGGAEVCSSVQTPKIEACNGEDDDCDGNADEDFAWTDPLAGGKVAVGGACGLGPCSGGTVACETLLSAVCTTEKNKKSDACNGLDDDCDGVTDDGSCEDGSACTTDVCDGKAKSCSNDSAVGCDDKNPCTGDACIPKDGSCSHVALTATCDDGDACTVGDACVADDKAIATCAPGAKAKDCDDANVCTDNSCDAKLGCVVLPNAVTMDCYDGGAATKGVGLCVGGVKACNNGKLDSACVGQVVPNAVELCDSKDDTCDGVTDEGCKAAEVAGTFSASGGRLSPDGKGTRVHAVLGHGSVGGGTAAAASGKTVKAGFIVWLQSLFE